MSVGWLLDRSLGVDPIKLPGTDKGVQEGRKQKSEGIAVVGADVKSLFPSLKNAETARLARKAILTSKIDFQDIDYVKALRYISVVGGIQLLERSGLRRLKPEWKGSKEILLKVGGDAAKDDKNWKDFKRTIFDSEKRKILATVIEIAVKLVMGSHVYVLCGNFFLQRSGGPIGIRSTACLASLIMKLWDKAWLELLHREGINIIDFFRYVDDLRNFSRPLLPGIRWKGSNFVFKKEW